MEQAVGCQPRNSEVVSSNSGHVRNFHDLIGHRASNYITVDNTRKCNTLKIGENTKKSVFYLNLWISTQEKK